MNKYPSHSLVNRKLHDKIHEALQKQIRTSLPKTNKQTQPAKSNPSPIEHIEAVALANYLEDLQRKGSIRLYTHIPNETFTTQWSVKLRNKQEGVKPGVPDYIVVTPKQVLFIELKRMKGGHLSLTQKIWLEQLGGKQTATFLAKGCDEAVAFIDMSLLLETNTQV